MIIERIDQINLDELKKRNHEIIEVDLMHGFIYQSNIDKCVSKLRCSDASYKTLIISNIIGDIPNLIVDYNNLLIKVLEFIPKLMDIYDTKK